MRAASFALVISLAGFCCLFAQPPAADPHEDPRANGGNRTGDTQPPPRDPHAVPDPIPVRATNPDASSVHPRAPEARPANDSEIMRKIRAALAKDPATRKSLSQVKVIAHAGSVTLQGTVSSAEVRRAIEQKATTVAAPGKVTNEINVKASPPKTPKRR
jgi:hypothetical protein